MDAIFSYHLSLALLDRLPSNDELRCLSHEEHARAAGIAFVGDRRRYLAAHVALRVTLATYLGVVPESLRFDTGRFGKPSLAFPPGPCAFSLSHSEDIAAIAVARGGQIGVDVEVLRDVSDATALAARYFSAAEQEQLRALTAQARDKAFLTCWTRKEACLKAIGSGLSVAPESFEVRTSPERGRVVLLRDGEPIELVVQSFSDRGPSVISVAFVVSSPSPARA